MSWTPESDARAERRRGGRRLIARLDADMAKIGVPDGIGAWDPAWEMIDPATVEFWICLTRWEATGSDDDKPALREAYFAVLEAWREAVAEYRQREEAGR